MTEDPQDPAPRRGYHHGNLKAALIDAALALIRARGPGGFSFADAAREAGVSAAAPYRHFKDREELLAETARQGFAIFADRLDAAWSDGKPGPLRAFEAVGRAYLAFARQEPAYFAAMFESGAAGPAASRLGAAGERVFQVLLRAATALAAQLPADRRPPAHMMAYHFWALAHGVAALFAGAEDAGRAPIPAEEMLESATAIWLRGLGFIPFD